MVVDRVLGDAALRGALAARDAGADMDVLVIVRGRPRRARVDGMRVRYVPRLLVARLVGDVVHAHDARAAAAVRGVSPCVTFEAQAAVDVPATVPAHRADTVLLGGALTPQNRHADVLRALWLLRDRRPPVSCQIAGDGPEHARLQDLAAELGVPVAFGTGPAAVFALASVEQESHIPYAEALAAGMPAIGCRYEPGPERLSALTDAMVLVAPADPEALARAIDALLADEPERRRLGLAGRAAVAKHLSWSAHGRAAVTAYEEALRP